MNRVGFVLKVRTELIEDYKRDHESVWPDMLDALRHHGWHNYSLFLKSDGTLFGYFETSGSFEDALKGMAGEPVNERWQELMARYFEGTSAAPDQMVELVEVFHLD